MEEDLKAKAQEALAKWTPLSETAAEAQISMPIHVVLGEAVDVASMLDHFWQPSTTRGRTIPGFAGVVKASQVTQTTGQEIRELQMAVAAAHSEYLMLVEAPENTPMDRADFVLNEVRATLEFVFDDGVEDDADQKLLRLQQAFPDSGSQDAMALALDGYADLADAYRDRLQEIEGFDFQLVAEARRIAAQLRARSGAALTRNPAAQRQLLALRNRMLTQLNERVRQVRKTAQYVFRMHPDITRRFTSAYERRQRAARRRATESADTETSNAGE